MWSATTTTYPKMAAKDAIYFFAPVESTRRDILLQAIPVFGSSEELADWLYSFSSTRFEKHLVAALLAHLDAPHFKHWASLDPTMAYRQIALIGAELDRLAWLTGQRSMTLASAAPVWRP